MLMAPCLIVGWGTGIACGVAGAAIASLISIVYGILWRSTFFENEQGYLRFSWPDWRPEPAQWRRILVIGLPTGFEFAMIAAYQLVVYTIARPFGASAQAGFGIGMRIIQAGFMPVVALGFAVAPVAGQNFGARLGDRVRATFKDAALLAISVMAVLTIVCHVAPEAMIRVFTSDPAVVDVGREYLIIISWNFIASGVVFVASSMFQAMGNTVPSLAASAARLLLVVVPAFALSSVEGFELRWVWYLSAGAVWVQLALALWLLRREYARRLTFAMN
jgi:Na+-driven multidrug efflux pump